MTATQSPVERLEAHLGQSWEVLRAARERTRSQMSRLREVLSKPDPIDSSDRSVIAFGSIAREEATDESDLDWTLLIDGQVDPSHLPTTQEIADRLANARFKHPNRVGAFGSMAFSHTLVHNIGGEDDTNRNLTRRMLLLLESASVGSDAQAYDRVITGVLHRYLDEDAGLAQIGVKPVVPRFFLNDVARFWRTMAVDFAMKQRERRGQGWGLRNVKLRFARKLIFSKGLLMGYSSALTPTEDPGALHRRLQQLVRMTPLDVLADVVLSHGSESDIGGEIFDTYDRYLGVVSDSPKRAELEKLRPADAGSSSLFQEVRTLSHSFQDALNRLFFDHPRIGKLTKEYGVF